MFKLIVLAAFVACASAVAILPSAPYGVYSGNFPYGGADHAPLASAFPAYHAGYHGTTYAAPIVKSIAPVSTFAKTYSSVVHGSPAYAGAYHAPLAAAAYPAYHAPIASAYHAPIASAYAAPIASAYAAPIASPYGYGAPIVKAGYAAPLAAAYGHSYYH